MDTPITAPILNLSSWLNRSKGVAPKNVSTYPMKYTIIRPIQANHKTQPKKAIHICKTLLSFFNANVIAKVAP